jgi:arabinofuranosyltransferase
MTPKLLRNLLFSLLLLGFFYYAYRYIESTAFLIGGEKYYVLFDDAMISMRYAYNLAHGLGAVWNAGERVEGFTNPLWVGFMALVHLLPIPLSKTSLVIQISGAIFLAATLYFVRQIVEHFTDDLLTMLAAVALTAFYQPLHSWALLGMEVSLLCLMLTAALWLILKNEGRFTPSALGLLAVSTLVRFDMAVPFVVILTVLAVTQKQYRKQNLMWGLGLLVLFLGVQTIARYLYYGELLPNTYYLKVEDWPFALRILRGLYALVLFIYYSNWVLFLLPLSLFFFRRDWKVTLLLAVIAGQLAYSVYVGGDAWEEHGGANRYIAIAMPLFFAAFALALNEIYARIVALLLTTKARSHKGTKKKSLMTSGLGAFVVSDRFVEGSARAVWLVFMVFSVLNFNALIGDWKSIERWTFNRRPDYTAGNEHNLQIALALQEATTSGASIAVIGAGTIPYLLPDRHAIDILGKADPVIAHGSVRTPMSIVDVPGMRPGHMKWNYAHTFGELKPDVIVSIWEGTGEEAAPYLEDYVYAEIGDKIRIYLLKDSPNILWEKVLLPN